MKTVVSLICILVIIAASNAFPALSDSETESSSLRPELETTLTSLLDVDHLASSGSESKDELKRSARALGLLSLGFGGIGGLGNKFGGLGGLGGLGHGLGGGLGGGLLSFKKPFLFKGGF